MAANNMICIQKRNGRYWVWMGLIDEKEHTPAKSDAKFYELEDARAHARDWIKNAHVQYGIWEISDL
jgi:hypothetical protein